MEKIRCARPAPPPPRSWAEENKPGTEATATTNNNSNTAAANDAARDLPLHLAVTRAQEIVKSFYASVSPGQDNTAAIQVVNDHLTEASKKTAEGTVSIREVFDQLKNTGLTEAQVAGYFASNATAEERSALRADLQNQRESLGLSVYVLDGGKWPGGTDLNGDKGKGLGGIGGIGDGKGGIDGKINGALGGTPGIGDGKPGALGTGPTGTGVGGDATIAGALKKLGGGGIEGKINGSGVGGSGIGGINGTTAGIPAGLNGGIGTGDGKGKGPGVVGPDGSPVTAGGVLAGGKSNSPDVLAAGSRGDSTVDDRHPFGGAPSSGHGLSDDAQLGVSTARHAAVDAVFDTPTQVGVHGGPSVSVYDGHTASGERISPTGGTTSTVTGPGGQTVHSNPVVVDHSDTHRDGSLVEFGTPHQLTTDEVHTLDANAHTDTTHPTGQPGPDREHGGGTALPGNDGAGGGKTKQPGNDGAGGSGTATPPTAYQPGDDLQGGGGRATPQTANTAYQPANDLQGGGGVRTPAATTATPVMAAPAAAPTTVWGSIANFFGIGSTTQTPAKK